MDRRTFLAMLAAVDILAIRGSDAAGPLPLRTVASQRGLIFGAAARPEQLEPNPALAELYAREAAIIVPENDGKWAAIRPAPDRFEFAGLDPLVAFARAHN